MGQKPSTTPVDDSVPKVGGEIAVGENLRFQRRWWTFERLIWPVFLIVIISNCLGLFGHGWLSNANASDPTGALTIEYERIERANTPSTMTLRFGPGAIRNGEVQVYVSNSVIQELGAQRIAPQPAVSAIGADGISYTFPASMSPASVQFQLQPTEPGRHSFRVGLLRQAPVQAHVFVVP